MNVVETEPDPLVRAATLVKVGLGVAGAAMIAAATRLPWYSQEYEGVSGFGTGMGDNGMTLVWFGLLIAVCAFGAGIHRVFVVVGLALAAGVVAILWRQLDQEHGWLVDALGPEMPVHTAPLIATWLLLGGAAISCVGLLLMLRRR